MRVNKIDFHFSKLRYQPDFEHFSDANDLDISPIGCRKKDGRASNTVEELDIARRKGSCLVSSARNRGIGHGDVFFLEFFFKGLIGLFNDRWHIEGRLDVGYTDFFRFFRCGFFGILIGRASG